MLIKQESKHAGIIEGLINATLVSVKGLPDEINPEKVVFDFTPDGSADIRLSRELVPSLDAESSCLRVIEAAMGRELTKTDTGAGVDLQTLIGRPVTIGVGMRSGAGGKLVPMVAFVLPRGEYVAKS